MPSIQFYTDVHISKQAVRQLRNRGIDIVHCTEVDLADADDETHLQYAAHHQRVMVSCDEDFERYHVEWQRTGREHSGIIYVQMGEKCKDIGLIVKEILFLEQAAVYETDLYNQVWRV